MKDCNYPGVLWCIFHCMILYICITTIFDSFCLGHSFLKVKSESFMSNVKVCVVIHVVRLILLHWMQLEDFMMIVFQKKVWISAGAISYWKPYCFIFLFYCRLFKPVYFINSTQPPHISPTPIQSIKKKKHHYIKSEWKDFCLVTILFFF